MSDVMTLEDLLAEAESLEDGVQVDVADPET